MKKSLFIIAVFAALAQLACSDSAPSSATEQKNDIVAPEGYEHFGLEALDVNGAVSVQEMYNTVNEKGAFDGRVAATITQVCQKAGCWIKVAVNDSTEMMVFFKDHFGIPIQESASKDVIFRGIAKMDTLSVDFQKHLLDDAREAGEEVSQEEYDAITEPKYKITFEADGILVKK
ncbi:MAG: DUF4920 domain-containing protein [Flavobacteriales bacterium]